MKVTTKTRRYLREAKASLLLARLVVRSCPADWIFQWAARPPKHTYRFTTNEVQWSAWSIEAAATTAWFKTGELERSIAALRMLRKRGIGTRLCLGVSHEGGELRSRVWLESGQDIIAGARRITGVTRMAEFGAVS